jgi:hypothetical protein
VLGLGFRAEGLEFKGLGFKGFGVRRLATGPMQTSTSPSEIKDSHRPESNQDPRQNPAIGPHGGVFPRRIWPWGRTRSLRAPGCLAGGDRYPSLFQSVWAHQFGETRLFPAPKMRICTATPAYVNLRIVGLSTRVKQR